MYELRKQHNIFYMGDSEVRLGANRYLRSIVPEIVYLSEEHSTFSKPLFTANESFLELFYELDNSIKASDLLLPYPQLKQITSKKEELKKILKSNERILEKIKAAIEFIKSTKHQQNPFPPATTSKIPKLSFDKNVSLIVSLPMKRISEEELKTKIEQESTFLLDSIKDWTGSSANHKSIIYTMEHYKKLVRKYIHRYCRKQDPIDRLYNLLAGARNTHINEANTLSSNGNENLVENQEKHVLKKKIIKSKDKCIWTQLNLWFMGISENMKGSLDSIILTLPNSKIPIQFLNVAAINRLSAIAKMLQYCLNNGITVAEFMEDRTYQKIKARLKRMEKTGTSGSNKDTMYYPSLDEIPYLLSLRNDNVEIVVNQLKSNIILLHNTNTSLRNEEELQRVWSRNRRIIEKMKKKIPQTTENTIPRTEISRVISRKRRRKERKHEKRKIPKLEDSNSDTNTTPKEHSLKTTPPIIDKPKFKVIKCYHISEKGNCAS